MAVTYKVLLFFPVYSDMLERNQGWVWLILLLFKRLNF